MSAGGPPALPAARAAAERAIARAAGVARVSSLAMLVLGAVSVVVCIRAPWSAGFAISVAVCVNGWLERRFGRRLAALDTGAPWRLALNQVALGLEVLVYAAWQARAIGPDQIDAVLRRPLVAQFLAALDPAALAPLLEQLPATVRVVYFVVGGGTCLGCLATAGYYGSRARVLRALCAGQGGG